MTFKTLAELKIKIKFYHILPDLFCLFEFAKHVGILLNNNTSKNRISKN